MLPRACAATSKPACGSCSKSVRLSVAGDSERFMALTEVMRDLPDGAPPVAESA